MVIDEEWLGELRFETVMGGTVVGVEGVGEEAIVFKVEFKDRKPMAMRVPKKYIAWAIKEIPRELTPNLVVDLKRINDKLFLLLGDYHFDEYSAEIDRFYAMLVTVLWESGNTAAEDLTLALPDATGAAFVLSTPGLIRRLREFATLTPIDMHGDRNVVMEKGAVILNPLSNTLRRYARRNPLIKWARDTIHNIECIQASEPDMKLYAPETLHSNHLFVWACAVLEGLILDSEVEAAARFVNQRFGRITDRSDKETMLAQLTMFLDAYAYLMQPKSLELVVKFCAHIGYGIQLYDRNWQIVADGYKYL